MKISAIHQFDYPASTVWEMLHDPDSHVAKFTRMGHRNIEVESSELTDTTLDIVLVRQVEMDIPSVAKKFIQPTNTVTSIDHWEDRGDGTYGGNFSVDIKGAPAESKGTTKLVPINGEACEYTVEVDVKVKVPLVGEKIAGALRPQLEEQLQGEFEAAEAWLGGDR
jgi:carbon monoxide dehydrogenase subunit G